MNTVIITPDGKSIISGASDGKIKMWDLDTGQEIKTINAHDYDYVLSIALFPDGKRLVSSSSGGEVKIWDLQIGQELHSLKWHKSEVNCVAISPDGHYIASGSSGNSICIWDSAEGIPVHQISDEYSIASIQFTADGRLVAASGDRIRVWDMSDLNRLRQLADRTIGHDAPVIQTAVLKNLDLSITLDAVGSAKLWDPTTGVVAFTLEDFGVAFVNCDDGRLISIAEKFIKIWDTSTWQPQTFTISSGSTYYGRKIEGIAVTSDNYLVVCIRRGQWMNIRSFNLANGEKVYSGMFGYADEGWEIFRIMAGAGELIDYQVHETSSGKMIITPDERHAIFYFSHIKSIIGVDIRSHTDKFINFLPIIGEMSKWSMASMFLEVDLPDRVPSELITLIQAGFEREIFNEHGKLVLGVNDIAITQDGKYLLAAMENGLLAKWDLGMSAPAIAFVGHEGSIKFVRVMKDGERVLSISYDGTIKVWRLNSAECEQTLTGFTSGINHIALSDDGRYLGISTQDTALLLWDLPAGQLITRFYGESNIDHFDFAPNGKLVIAGERSGRVHILRVEHL